MPSSTALQIQAIEMSRENTPLLFRDRRDGGPAQEREHTHENGSAMDRFKLDLKAGFCEFLGTCMFLFLGLGGIQAASVTSLNEYKKHRHDETSSGAMSPDQLMLIATSMGLSLVVSAWSFFRVTGSIFNPQVGLALLLCGVISPMRFVFTCVAQLAGAVVASGLVHLLLGGPIEFATSISPGTSTAQAVWLEALMTATLVLSVLMLAAEKHRASYLAPVGFGLTLFVTQLFGGPYTGAAVNSARAFGPAVIHGFESRHWAYWVGPSLGSLIGTAVYFMLTVMAYWNINPLQDTDAFHASPRSPLGIPSIGRALFGETWAAASRTDGHGYVADEEAGEGGRAMGRNKDRVRSSEEGEGAERA